MNKVLKDIILRYQILRGNRVHYHPGWDCHGLPIEQKVSSTFVGLSPDQVDPMEMRKACRKAATEGVNIQKKDFSLFGLMADWSKETTYRTYDSVYEMQQLKVFGEMARRGLIYRAYRPVYWSPSSRTALAEAEIEHKDIFSRSVYVNFPILPGKSLLQAADGNEDAKTLLQNAVEGRRRINAVIWTTTAWSLPSNMALNVNPEMQYSLLQAGDRAGTYYIVATERIKAFEKVKIGLSTVDSKHRPEIGPVVTLLEFPGTALLDSTYRHPFLSKKAKGRPILPAAYVTAETGTGLVHSAPAHGLEDYKTWQEYCRSNDKAAKEEIISPINGAGHFEDKLDHILQNAELSRPGEEAWQGLVAMGTGGKELIRLLQKENWLIGEHPYNHSYPHDWRTKQPIMTRATSQWFADLGPIKERAIKALKKVRFIPEAGRARLEAFVHSRNEWCISRQRVWGVPIPVVYNSKTNEPLLSPVNIQHIIRVLQEKGTDYWWQGEAEEFVSPQEKEEGVFWSKGKDTMDVWFDSGSAWSQSADIQQDKEDTSALISSPRTPPADVYLEGSDQHRGWFQSSLLTFVGTSSPDVEPVAPYKTVITHGFTINRRGEKMSKSENNFISPQFFLLGGPKQINPAYGADPVRWWTSRIDYASDIIVSALVIKHAGDELRKVRNTFRFLLAYVPTPGQVVPLEQANLDFISRYMMIQIRELGSTCKIAYDNYDFAQVTRRITEFCNTTVSSFYLPACKDILYCNEQQSEQRQGIITVMNEAIKMMLSTVAPIAPHLAEEVWHFYNGAQGPPTESDPIDKSYFHNTWYYVPNTVSEIEEDSIMEDVKVLFDLRDSIQFTVEAIRQQKEVKAATQVDILLDLSQCSENVRITIEERRDDLERILGISRMEIVDSLPERKDESQIWPILDDCGKTKVRFAIEMARGHRCLRCWKHTSEKPQSLCNRCAKVLHK